VPVQHSDAVGKDDYPAPSRFAKHGGFARIRQAARKARIARRRAIHRKETFPWEAKFGRKTVVIIWSMPDACVRRPGWA
jgi:hypothetical protein